MLAMPFERDGCDMRPIAGGHVRKAAVPDIEALFNSEARRARWNR